MLGFLVGWWRARAVRPLLWWVLALAVYALFPVPQEWVLALIVGLGVALTITVRRLREGGQRAVDTTERVWGIADRLSAAVEDRIRHAAPPPPPMQAAPYGYAEMPRPQLAPMAVVYDPGALLSAIAAVLGAEGLPVNAAPALPACADLLTWQGISPAPGGPAPTAWALATGLTPGAARRYRAAPPALLAACIGSVLIADGVLPPQLTPDQANALVEGAAVVLDALNIAPDPRADAEPWPVMTEIITTAPHHHGAW
jgi:hypothetical protein